MSDRIFLFYGEEDFLIRERVEEFKKRIADPSFNLEQIDAEEPDQERIVSALQTNPLLGGEKLVVIRHADLKKEGWEALMPALKSVPPGITIIIWAASVDRRSKIYKLIDEIGEVCEFKPFADWEQDQVVSWIRKRVQALGKEIDPPSALSLQEICGSSLGKLSSEIEKMVTFIGERRALQQEDVRALASPGEINSFALSDAVANKDLAGALSSFRVLYRNKSDLFQILSLLATQYRTMLQIKTLSGRLRDPRQIAQTLGASPYFVRKCLDKSKLFQEKELYRDLELILEADLKLKSGEAQLSVFELLLVSLCGK